MALVAMSVRLFCPGSLSHTQVSSARTDYFLLLKMKINVRNVNRMYIREELVNEECQ